MLLPLIKLNFILLMFAGLNYVLSETCLFAVSFIPASFPIIFNKIFVSLYMHVLFMPWLSCSLLTCEILSINFVIVSGPMDWNYLIRYERSLQRSVKSSSEIYHDIVLISSQVYFLTWHKTASFEQQLDTRLDVTFCYIPVKIWHRSENSCYNRR